MYRCQPHVITSTSSRTHREWTGTGRGGAEGAAAPPGFRICFKMLNRDHKKGLRSEDLRPGCACFRFVLLCYIHTVLKTAVVVYCIVLRNAAFSLKQALWCPKRG